MSKRLPFVTRSGFVFVPWISVLVVFGACGPSAARYRPPPKSTSSPSRAPQPAYPGSTSGDLSTSGSLSSGGPALTVAPVEESPVSDQVQPPKADGDLDLESLVVEICTGDAGSTKSLDDRIMHFVRGQQRDSSSVHRLVAERGIKLLGRVSRKWPSDQDDTIFRQLLILIHGVMMEDLAQGRAALGEEIERSRESLKRLQQQIEFLEQRDTSGQNEELVSRLKARVHSVISTVKGLGEDVARYDLRLESLRGYREQAEALDLSFEEIRTGLIEQLQQIVLGVSR